MVYFSSHHPLNAEFTANEIEIYLRKEFFYENGLEIKAQYVVKFVFFNTKFSLIGLILNIWCSKISMYIFIQEYTKYDMAN